MRMLASQRASCGGYSCGRSLNRRAAACGEAIEYLLVECGPQILARHLPAGGVTITSAWRWRMASTIW